MTTWIPSPREFVHKVAEHYVYALICTGLVWFVTFVWAAIDGWSPLAVWIGSLGAVAFASVIYIAIRLGSLQEAPSAAEHAGGKAELSFDRDAAQNYWYTFDSDDNRNINRYLAQRRWSMSIFSLMPTIFATSDITIHRVDLLAYNRHSERWESLEDRVQGGFPGHGVGKNVLEFQRTRPAFRGCKIGAGNSEKISIPAIGVFSDALSAEFTENPARWGRPETGRYVCVAAILHVHTRFLFFTCHLPEMSANSKAPAFFLGAPELVDTNNRAYFEQKAAHNLSNVGSLGVTERVTVPRVVG